MKDNLVYIKHILDAIDKIDSYIKGYGYEKFKKDNKTLDAAVREIEIIGEAAGKCAKEFQKKYPQIPWREMKDARNKMIHDYMGVAVEVVWGICKNDLPELKKVIKQIFSL